MSVEAHIGRIHEFLIKSYSSARGAKVKYFTLAHDTDTGANALDDFPAPPELDDAKLLKLAQDMWQLAGNDAESRRSAQRYVVVRMSASDKPQGEWAFHRSPELGSGIGGTSESPTLEGFVMSTYRQAADARRSEDDAHKRLYDVLDMFVTKQGHADDRLVKVIEGMTGRLGGLEQLLDGMVTKEFDRAKQFAELQATNMKMMLDLQIQMKREARWDRIVGHLETIALNHPTIAGFLSGGLKAKLGAFVTGLNEAQKAGFFSSLSRDQAKEFVDLTEHVKSPQSTDDTIAEKFQAFMKGVDQGSQWEPFERSLTPDQVHAITDIAGEVGGRVKALKAKRESEGTQSPPVVTHVPSNGHSNGAPTNGATS